MPRFRPLYNSVRTLVRSWYTIDRIRIAPTTGRLLQLQIEDSVLLRDTLYAVQQRSVHSDNEGERLSYLLSSDTKHATLTVNRNAATGSVEGELFHGDVRTTVFDSDVVILQSETKAGNSNRSAGVR